MTTKRIRALLAIIIPALSLISILALYRPQSVSALPQIFTVTNTNDSGAGSLRQAVTDANSNGNPGDQDTIEFDISGLETKRINILSSISITEPAIIDGYTQGNASQNTALFPEPLNGLIRIELLLMDDSVVNVLGDDVTLKGVALSRDWLGSGEGGSIIVSGADNFRLQGSYLGTDFSGTMFSAEADAGNDIHVEIDNSQNALLGGSDPADRNVFMYCSGVCITAGGSSPGSSSGLDVRGNYIGLASDGITVDQFESTGVQINSGADDATIGGLSSTDGNMFVDNNVGSLVASNVSGLEVYANRFYHNKQYRASSNGSLQYGVLTLLGVSDSQLGSSVSGASNYIAGNLGIAVFIDDSELSSSNNLTIESNIFGSSYDGLSAFTNGGSSIEVAGSTEDVLITSNTIHHSSNLPEPSGNFAGISILEDANDISVIQNSIYDNSQKGISIENAGNNDPLDVDMGANNILNYPEWYSIVEDGGDTSVDFTADLPAGDYRVEFFSNTVADPSGRGEGEVYLGYATIISAGAPNNFSHTLTGITGVTNLSLTATEIDGSNPSGFGATSEFGGEGTEYVVPHDISIEKSLDDPENYYPGNTVQYTVTLTNTGDYPIDLTLLDGSGLNPLNSNLFTDFLAPGMTLNSVVSGDVACNNLGDLGSLAPGSPYWANHQEYQALLCAYTGGDSSFEPDESISITIGVDLAVDFDLSLPNIAVAGVAPGDSGEDVSNYCFNTASEPEATQDVIDCLLADNSGDANIAQNEVPSPNLTIYKTLTDPQDFVQSGQVTYSVTVSNDGTASLDLSIFDGSGINPLATSLIFDFIPPDMTYLSSSNSDLSCSVLLPQLGLAGATFANHADYAGLSCTYIGGSDLGPAEEISTDLTFQLSSDSSLNYTNYAVPGWTPQDPGNAVAGQCLTDAYQPEATQDALDCLITDQSGDADIAWAGAPTDVAIGQTFSAPNGVSPGSAVSYTYTFTNNGPGDVSLPWYNNGAPLFVGIFPGEDLTFVSATSATSGLNCSDVGPGTAIFAGTMAEDHTSHNLVPCFYGGADNITLTTGQSVSITINATVNQASDGQFTNYLMHATTPSDPDSVDLYQFLFTAQEDALDTHVSPLLSRLSYPNGSDPDTDGGGGNSGGSGSLSDTGDSVKILVVAGALLFLASICGALILKKKGRN